MARHTFNMAGVNQTWQTILWDEEGNPLLEVSAGEYVIHESDGSVNMLRNSNAIQLMCKQMWRPGPKAQPLGVCELCRYPPYRFPFREKPKHGLVSLKYAKLCAGSCGRLLCPRHANKCKDRHYCCPSCALKYTLKNCLASVFFHFEEEA